MSEGSMSHKCQKRVYNGRRDDWIGHQCGRPARVQEEGRWLCSLHTADGIKKRNEAIQAKWKAQDEIRDKRIEQNTKDKQKLALFDELLEALKAYVQDDECMSPDYDTRIESHPTPDHSKYRCKWCKGYAAISKAGAI